MALRYGLPSRFTSYLVQEPEAVVAMPADWTLRGASAGSAHFSNAVAPKVGSGVAALAAPAPTTGKIAVQAATFARRMREMASSEDLDRAEAGMMADAVDGRRDGTVGRAGAGLVRPTWPGPLLPSSRYAIASVRAYWRRLNSR